MAFSFWQRTINQFKWFQFSVQWTNILVNVKCLTNFYRVLVSALRKSDSLLACWCWCYSQRVKKCKTHWLRTILFPDRWVVHIHMGEWRQEFSFHHWLGDSKEMAGCFYFDFHCKLSYWKCIGCLYNNLIESPWKFIFVICF